jgi:hypothetical protein
VQKERVKIEPWSCAASSYVFMDEEPVRMLICCVEVSVWILRAGDEGGEARILGKINSP